MNKKLFFLLSGVLILFVSCIVWMVSPSETMLIQKNSDNAITSTNTTMELSEAERERKERRDHPEDIEKLIQSQINKFHDQPGNIEVFLRELKANCPSNLNCVDLLKNSLKRYPDQIFAKQLSQLIQRLPDYERQMQSTVLSTHMDAEERYQILWHLKEKMLGKSEALLGYAVEQNYAKYQFEYARLLEQAGNERLEERLKKMELLNQKYPFTKELETYEGYNKTLALALVDVTDAYQQQQIKQNIRLQFFKQDEIEKMNVREAELQRQQQQMQQYMTKLNRLDQDMQKLKSKLSEQEWDQQYQSHLEQLRLESF